MNRPLKFRIWSKITKAMSPPIELKRLAYETFDSSLDPLNDEYTVFMQYTGVKDKDGVEIYEGDIAEFRMLNEFGSWQVIRSIMKWHVGGFGFEAETEWIFTGVDNIAGAKIIGNIWENPELIEKI